MKSFLFDLDGTIIDSRYDIAKSVNAALRGLGLDVLPEEQVVSYVGNGIRVLMTRALGDRAGDFDLEHAVALFLEAYNIHLTERTVPYEGIEEVLKRLSGTGVLMMVVTNKPVIFTEKLLEHFRFRGFFHHVYGADSLPFKKPEAALFHELVSRHSIDPAEAFMIGDSPVDESFARQSGIPFIFARYGNFIGNEEKGAIRADYGASDCRELGDILSSLAGESSSTFNSMK